MFNAAAIAAFMPSYLWTGLCGLLLTIGDITMRTWFATHWRGGLVTTLALYTVGMVCLVFSFFGKNIAVASVAAVVLNAIAYLTFAHFAYGDVLEPKAYIGIALGLIAIAVLETA